MSWYITNTDIKGEGTYSTNLKVPLPANENPSVFIDGYIVPRKSHFQKMKHLSQTEVINELYKRYETGFINHVKGVFIIILLYSDSFMVFTDRHGIKKFFVYSMGDTFMVTDSLLMISDRFNLTPDRVSIAQFMLLSHFIDGCSLYREVRFSRPGEYVIVNGKRPEYSFYWRPHAILDGRESSDRNDKYYAGRWRELVDNYREYLRPKGVSVMVTGGNDSRMVLAALLEGGEGTGIHAFTYGDPQSRDSVIAARICEEIKIGHTNYHVSDPSPEWFERLAVKIIEQGNSMVNIHRAHRLDAALHESQSHPSCEMLFTGLVGGEYFKRPRYNDVNIPLLFLRLQKVRSRKEGVDLLKNALREKAFRCESKDLNLLYDRLQAFIGYGKGYKRDERLFIYVYLYYGGVHHIQDPAIYGREFKYVVNPFMDVDFLEMIAGSEKWYLNRRLFPAERIFHSEFFVAITDLLAPQLSDIPYAKRGMYTARQLLHAKTGYLFSRLRYFLRPSTEKYPANFPMGPWLYRFCEKKINQFPSELSREFDVSRLKKHLSSMGDMTREEDWHIVTNPINIIMNHDQYRKAQAGDPVE